MQKIFQQLYWQEKWRISQVENESILLAVLGLVAILFVFRLLRRRLLRRRFWLFFYVTFLATLMHELSHFITSMLLNGKPQGISVSPSRTTNGYVLGHVISRNMRWYNGTMIALAPFFLIVTAYIFFFQYISNETMTYWMGVKLYFLASLIEGGFPSSTDFRLALKYSIAPVTLAAILLMLLVQTS